MTPSKCYRIMVLAAASVVWAGWPQIIRADDNSADNSTASPPDKTDYNLFRVTPSDQLRPLAIDANDGVTDPTTVDPGYLQLQGSLVDYYEYSTTYGRSVNFNEDHFAWGPRLTLGVLNNVDVFIHPSFQTTSYQYSGSYNASGISGGYEGINIGAKINLWGNDGGKTAFAVAPYISIPNSDGTVQGGADIAFAVRLPEAFYLKFNVNPYALEHNHDESFGMEDSMSLHRTFDSKFDTYAYLNTDWQTDGVPWLGYAGFGVAYFVSPGLEVFLGLGFGLTSDSYDYNPRLGLGWRF